MAPQLFPPKPSALNPIRPMMNSSFLSPFRFPPPPMTDMTSLTLTYFFSFTPAGQLPCLLCPRVGNYQPCWSGLLPHRHHPSSHDDDLGCRCQVQVRLPLRRRDSQERGSRLHVQGKCGIARNSLRRMDGGCWECPSHLPGAMCCFFLLSPHSLSQLHVSPLCNILSSHPLISPSHHLTLSLPHPHISPSLLN